jgi:hypothetical protein
MIKDQSFAVKEIKPETKPETATNKKKTKPVDSSETTLTETKTTVRMMKKETTGMRK